VRRELKLLLRARKRELSQCTITPGAEQVSISVRRALFNRANNSSRSINYCSSGADLTEWKAFELVLMFFNCRKLQKLSFPPIWKVLEFKFKVLLCILMSIWLEMLDFELDASIISH
jgi:hypothetical protein